MYLTCEHPSQFLDHLTKALLQYTNLGPDNPNGKQLLMSYFFSHTLTIPGFSVALKFIATYMLDGLGLVLWCFFYQN